MAQGPECSLCCEAFSEDSVARVPRLLPCGHTFCHECLDRLMVRGAIQCPNRCREHVRIGAARAGGLPKNFALIDMLRVRAEPAALRPAKCARRASLSPFGTVDVASRPAKRARRTAPSSSLSPSALIRGMQVRVHGLVEAVELNGMTGKLTSFFENIQRWQVEFSHGGCRTIKPENVTSDSRGTGMKVVVRGLQEAVGLNGRTGELKRFLEDSRRWQVNFPQHGIRSIKPQHLAERA